MRADFQEEILKFILQSKQGKKYLPLLDKDLWDLPENQIAYDLYKNYFDKYGAVPTKVTLMEFFDREIRKKKGAEITQQVYQAIEKQVYKLYTPFEAEDKMIRESIIEFAQKKKAKDLFRDRADGVKHGDSEFFRSLVKDMNSIAKMSDFEVDKEKTSSGLLLRDYQGLTFDDVISHPTYLRSLNDLTAEGGFYTPQLIILMGGPKAYKTGVMLKILAEYVRDGRRVYYPDAENGLDPIKKRFYQCIMECSRRDLKDPQIRAELAQMVKAYGIMGGDFQNGFFAGKTMDDVEFQLQEIFDETGWSPEIIGWDYLAKFKPSNPAVAKQDKRFQIAANYEQAIAINGKWGAFAFSPATVARNAINKPVVTVKDFGEDIQQAYNCHAAFALCQTDEEIKEKIARIIPVVQREGEQFTGDNVCTIQIDHARQVIVETSMQKIMEDLKRKQNLSDE